MNVIFDTNVFNHILKGDIPVSIIPSEYVVQSTHIQYDELYNTSDQILREKLLSTFIQYTDAVRPTESAVYGVSLDGFSKFTDPNRSLVDKIRGELDLKRKKQNNLQDALIGDTAIQNEFTLVTNDQDLKSVISSLGGSVVDLRIAN